MQIPLLRGRMLNEHDTAGAPVAVLVRNPSPTANLPARTLSVSMCVSGPTLATSTQPWATIVGVVGNVKQESLASTSKTHSTFPLPNGPGSMRCRLSSSARELKPKPQS